MIASLLVTLREGIEATLIIGIIVSYLKRVGAYGQLRLAYLGAALGIVASVSVGGAFMLLSLEFEGTGEQVFEGVTMLLAAAILTTMLLWMRDNSRAFSDDLRQRAAVALAGRRAVGIASLAFVSIFREGIETVLFLGSASFTSTGAQLLIGGTIGLGIALALALGIIKYSVRLDLRTFFRVTGALLVFFAAGLVAHGVHEFVELGVVPHLVEHVWDTNWILDDHGDAGRLFTALFGYNGDPSLAELIAYVSYWLAVVFGVHRDATFVALRRLYAAIRPA